MHHRPLLACALLLGACFSSSSPSAPAGSTPAEAQKPLAPDYSATIADPLGFLPLDSELVLSVDAAQVRQSALWKAFEPRLMEAAGAGLSTFQELCGVDPVRSLRGLSMGLKGKGADLEAVFVVSGFDRAQIMECVARDSKPEVTIDGAFVTVSAADDDEPMAFAFVDASTLVATFGKSASKESLQAVLAAGSPLRSSPAFADMFARLDTRASVWMVIGGSYLDDAASLGATMQAVFGSLTLRDGVDAVFRMRLETAAQASQLSSMMQSQLGAAQAFLDKIEVHADDIDLVVDAAMTAEQVDNLVRIIGQF